MVLIGHGSNGLPNDAREYFNTVAADLGTDLRLNADHIVDDEANLNEPPALPTTTHFNEAFDPY